MIEDKHIQGEWWVPENPNNKICGILDFNQKTGSILSLQGTLCRTPEEAMTSLIQRKEYKLLFGRSVDGEPITLINCVIRITLHNCSKHTKENFLNNITSRGTAQFALLGHHFDHYDKITFKKLVLSYTNLIDWVGGLELDAKHPEMDFTHIHLDARIPNRVEFEIKNECVGNIGGVINSSEFNVVQKNITLRADRSINVEFFKEKKLSDCLHFIQIIRKFLSFVTHKPVSSTGFTGFFLDVAENNLELRIGILFRMKISDESYALPDEIIIPFNYAKDNFSEIISKWFGIYETLHNVIDLYSAVVARPDMYMDTQFLLFVQALEVYHRRTHENHVLNVEAHKKRLETIISGAPDENKTWLANKLEFSNEPRLIDRLSTLFNENEDILTHYVVDKEKFNKKVKNTRNYYTHYDKRLEKKVFKDNELVLATLRIRLILEVCLLKELEVPSDKIIKTILMNRHFAEIRIN